MSMARTRRRRAGRVDGYERLRSVVRIGAGRQATIRPPGGIVSTGPPAVPRRSPIAQGSGIRGIASGRTRVPGRVRRFNSALAARRGRRDVRPVSTRSRCANRPRIGGRTGRSTGRTRNERPFDMNDSPDRRLPEMCASTAGTRPFPCRSAFRFDRRFTRSAQQIANRKRQDRPDGE